MALMLKASTSVLTTEPTSPASQWYSLNALKKKKKEQENVHKEYFCRPIKRGFLVFAYLYSVETWYLQGLVISFKSVVRNVACISLLWSFQINFHFFLHSSQR